MINDILNVVLITLMIVSVLFLIYTLSQDVKTKLASRKEKRIERKERERHEEYIEWSRNRLSRPYDPWHDYTKMQQRFKRELYKHKTKDELFELLIAGEISIEQYEEYASQT